MREPAIVQQSWPPRSASSAGLTFINRFLKSVMPKVLVLLTLPEKFRQYYKEELEREFPSV